MVMGGGEIELLLPNVVANFGDKVCQIRRRSTVPRCLFGPPVWRDPAEDERIYDDFLQKERERFNKRWHVNIEEIEAAIAKREEAEKKEKSRLPLVPVEVEDRLSPSEFEEEKTSRTSSCPVLSLRKPTACLKPCSNFQKRVRVAGNLKRQTHLTEFWRSRRSVAFLFGKTKTRSITVTDLLEAPVPKHN